MPRFRDVRRAGADVVLGKRKPGLGEARRFDRRRCGRLRCIDGGGRHWALHGDRAQLFAELAKDHLVAAGVALRPVLKPGVLQVLDDMPVRLLDLGGDRVAKRACAPGIAPQIEKELIERMPRLGQVNAGWRRPVAPRCLELLDGRFLKPRLETRSLTFGGLGLLPSRLDLLGRGNSCQWRGHRQ